MSGEGFVRASRALYHGDRTCIMGRHHLSNFGGSHQAIYMRFPPRTSWDLLHPYFFGVYHITPRPCLGSRRLHYHLGWPARHHLNNDIITHPPCRWEFMWSWCISGVSEDFISKRSSTRHHHSSTIWRRGSDIFGGFLKDSRSQIKGGFPWAAWEGHHLHL